MIRFSSTYGEVYLPNPILGDAEQYNAFMRYQMTMSKSIRTTKKTNTHSTFLLTIQQINQEDYNTFIDWFQNSQGITHNYLDYDGVTHMGFIKNEPIELTISGKKYCGTESAPQFEYADLTVEFEAVNGS